MQGQAVTVAGLCYGERNARTVEHGIAEIEQAELAEAMLCVLEIVHFWK
jgi:hypothetical protein